MPGREARNTFTTHLACASLVSEYGEVDGESSGKEARYSESGNGKEMERKELGTGSGDQKLHESVHWNLLPRDFQVKSPTFIGSGAVYAFN